MAQRLSNHQAPSLSQLGQRSEEGMQKSFDLGGQIKLGHFLFAENEKAGLYQLKYLPREKEASGLADQVQVQLWGNHAWERSQFFWKIDSSAQKGDLSLESEQKNKP